MAAELLGDERFEIGLGQLHFAISEFLESRERGFETVTMDLDPHFLERVAERGSPRVLAQHQLGLAHTDRRRIHDLVGGAFAQHAVLVDAGLVRERVTAHDCLVELDRVAGEAANDARRASEFVGLDAGVDTAEGVSACLQGHHDLFECGVARSLADAVDGAFDLAGARIHRGQAIGDGQAEIIVTMRRDHVVAGDATANAAQQLGPLFGYRVADRIGNVEGRRARIDRSLEHRAHEVEVGPRRVFG